MATVTKGRTFVSGEVVTPTKLNTLVDSATVNGIVASDFHPSLAPVSTNTAGAIVSRDASGNFSAGIITADAFAGAGAATLVPPGAVMSFAMNVAPSGWLAASGAAVSRATYAALFAAIGTTYGVGNGSTTFTLPDLRGYFVRGAGTNGTDGTSAGTFGALQSDDFKSHTHTATVTDPGHTHTSNAQRITPGSGLGGGSQSVTATTTINSSTTGITVANASTGGTETRPRNIAMLYCIKF
jgi:microcystin-dependent protein